MENGAISDEKGTPPCNNGDRNRDIRSSRIILEMENPMNKFFKILSALAFMTLFITACASQGVQAQPAEPATTVPAIHDVLLGKSLSDREVADFIASNDCSPVEQFQLCRSAGLVLMLDAEQKVESVILYPGNDDGFAAYQDGLPYDLRFTDTMEMVEQKLGHPIKIDAPLSNWVLGLPDESVTPDHMHYVAVYKRLGMTIVYNSPSASDKGASIHSILVTEKQIVRTNKGNGVPFLINKRDRE
jgi:hypothetical protein